MKYITTSRRIFLVKFRTSTEMYIVQDRQLFDVIKENDGEIDYIRCADTYKVVFTRCSKALILRQFSWDTEVYLYFKSLVYFKNVKE